jgi:hypothetical protein
MFLLAYIAIISMNASANMEWYTLKKLFFWETNPKRFPNVLKSNQVSKQLETLNRFRVITKSEIERGFRIPETNWFLENASRFSILSLILSGRMLPFGNILSISP